MWNPLCTVTSDLFFFCFLSSSFYFPRHFLLHCILHFKYVHLSSSPTFGWFFPNIFLILFLRTFLTFLSFLRSFSPCCFLFLSRRLDWYTGKNFGKDMKYISGWAVLLLLTPLRCQNESSYVYEPSVWSRVHYACLYRYILCSPICTK